MDPDLKESVDFDFFDQRPESPGEVSAPNLAQSSASVPPVYPRSTKPPQSAATAPTDKNSESNEACHRSRSLSGGSRDSSPEQSRPLEVDHKDRPTDRLGSNVAKSVISYSRSVSNTSSIGSSYSSSSIALSDSEKSDISLDIQSGSRSSSTKKGKHSESESSSESEDRPTNPIAKIGNKPRNGRSTEEKIKHSLGTHSDRVNKKSSAFCDDDGDTKKSAGNVDKRQTWDERKETRAKSVKSNGVLNKIRPKTVTIRTDDDHDKRSRSSSNSDSVSDGDITDVSPIDTPRSYSQGKLKDKRGSNSKMTSAGDGHPAKSKSSSATENDQKDDADNDPDRTKGVDLRILMKAVEELEKQKRLQTSSRRVVFAPGTLIGYGKANYTFDRNQTRNIERENNRLLKQIVRQINTRGQRRHVYRPSSSLRLTPSAINREREIQRIESENLAFLKRLQSVKPTKSICRDQQLMDYENTTFHGVPIAALHPIPKGRHVQGYSDDSSSFGGRTRSVSSMTSVGSTARSVGSARSSRPRSACTRAPSVTKQLDNRPAWSDRW